MTLKELLRSDGALREAMKVKNAAILEALALTSRGDLPGAIRQYRKAGELEYQLFRYLEDAGLKGAALVNLISAASCWYEAEEFLAARKAVREALDRSGSNERMAEDCSELLTKIERALSSSRMGEGMAQIPEQVKA